jgi:hypothetical protein
LDAPCKLFDIFHGIHGAESDANHSKKDIVRENIVLLITPEAFIERSSHDSGTQTKRASHAGWVAKTA